VTKEPYPLQARIGHRVAAAARSLGLLIRPLGNVMVLLPPLSVSQHELAHMIEILCEAISTQTAREGAATRP
jgi:adenosylmethionine---8-amino-7-oxononanoate aminotransferase